MTPAGDGVLAAAVASADPAVLLPARRDGEAGRLVRPLVLCAALSLGSDALAPAHGYAALVADREGSLVAGPLVLEQASVRRAVPGDGATAALARLLRDGQDVPAGFEIVRLSRAAGPSAAADEAAIAVDQTHDSVRVAAGDGGRGGGGGGAAGGGVVVKWAVHVEPAAGEPPAVSAVRHLHASAFTEMPTPYGFLVAHLGTASVLLASATEYLADAQDGWDWCVQDVLALAEGRTPLATAVEPAAVLGGLVARMHLAFARPDPGAPEGTAGVTEVGAEHFAAWARRAAATLDEARAVTSGAEGERLRARDAAARSILSGLAGLRPASTAVTRIHGDLHVGQVLRWRGGYAVSDFDGNPVLPADERGQPQPPARDVAGMLRALDHVGRIVVRRTQGGAAAAVDGWIDAARAAFLAAYRSELDRAGASTLFDHRLLPAFEVEQECRELVYAARHLPRWTYVPDAALGHLLDSADESVQPGGSRDRWRGQA